MLFYIIFLIHLTYNYTFLQVFYNDYILLTLLYEVKYIFIFIHVYKYNKRTYLYSDLIIYGYTITINWHTVLISTHTKKGEIKIDIKYDKMFCLVNDCFFTMKIFHVKSQVSTLEERIRPW